MTENNHSVDAICEEHQKQAAAAPIGTEDECKACEFECRSFDYRAMLLTVWHQGVLAGELKDMVSRVLWPDGKQ